MTCQIHPFGSLKAYKYVVVCSFCRGKIVLSRHRARNTWEPQGGHIEAGETPEAAANRELWEESGAKEYVLRPLCDYWAGDEKGSACGQAFSAEITSFGPLPDSEMAEVRLFDALPENLTYPAITPLLFDEAERQRI